MEHKKINHQLPNTPRQATSTSKPNAWAKPLQTVQQQDFCQTHPAEAPDQGALVAVIEKLNQRLQAMEA